MYFSKIVRAQEVTLAILKPTVTGSPVSVNKILDRLDKDEKFNILAARKTEFTSSMAAKFYAEHEGKFFYPRLQAYIRSGPVIALALQGENVISEWRKFIGPTKVTRTKYLNPGTLRHDFGVSDTRNSFHGSDAPESASNELKIVFPEMEFNSESTNEYSIDIPEILTRSSDGKLAIIEPKYPRPNPEITENFSYDGKIIPLAKEDFWDNYHRKQKQDWFLNQNQALAFIQSHTELADSERVRRLTVLDVGTGTSTLLLRIIFTMKKIDGWAIDFSEEACRFQSKSVENLMENYTRKTGGSESLLVKNGNSLVVLKDDVRSLSCQAGSIDILIDKGTMDAFMRLDEVETYQAMDELARVLSKNGKILQITEEPPEARTERWFKWSQTTKYDVHVQQEELSDKFGYIVTLSEKSS